MQNSFHLFQSKRFLPLFITQFLGAFNDNAFKNAFLIWFTYDVAEKLQMNAHLMVTVASGLFILPFFLFSALAGQVADKFERSKLAQFIKLAEIFILAFSLIGFYLESVYLLLGIVFFMGVHSTFFGPIKYSLLPDLLKDGELISGNALVEGGTFLAILLGTIMGGILVTLPKGIEMISIFIFLLAVIGYFSSRFIPQTSLADSRLKISFNVISQTLEIMRYAKKDPTVWLCIMGISWFWFTGITFLSQFPIYTKNLISGNELIVTLFLALFSIGIGMGSITCNKLLKGHIHGKFLPLGFIGASISIFLFCLASYFYHSPAEVIGVKAFFTNGYGGCLITFSLFLIAFFSGIYIVPLYVMMQHFSEARYLSRIIAANNVLNALFMVFSSLAVIVFIEAGFSLLQIFGLLGCAHLAILFFLRRICQE